MGDNIVTFSSLRAACNSCDLKELCLPIGLAEADIDLLDNIIRRRKPLQRGDLLFRAGDPLHSIYAVRSGSVKTTYITADGEAQITGFALPGELVGLDGIHGDTHRCTARALETSSVCEVPFDMLEDLTFQVKGLRRRLLQLMGQELTKDQELLLLLGKRSADERLAIFLLNVSTRHRNRGLSGDKFRLSMSRTDIANYLGLALETVSRLFTRMQELKILLVEGKEIQVLDRVALSNMASLSTRCAGDESRA